MHPTRPLRFVALAAGTLPLCLLFLIPGGRAEEADATGAERLKTDILAVLAHPDDETGSATTLAYYAHAEARSIACVYATRGEGGGNMVGRHWGPALGILREAELRACLEGLGVKRWFFLDQLDWAYTESAAMTLRKWDREKALERLVRLIRALRPEVILTMNPRPRPGQHGHHQAAGILAIEAWSAAADPGAFPRQLSEEGLDPWQTRKLFLRGEATPGRHLVTVDGSGRLPSGVTPARIAGDALSEHRSQGFARMRGATWLRRPQSFLLARSAVPIREPTADSLFAGLGDDLPDVLPEATPDDPAAASLRFIGRPAVEHFRGWARRHRVAYLTADLPADLPVVAGEEARLELHAPAGLDPADIEVEPIPGWPEPALEPLPPDPAGGSRHAVRLLVPADARDDVTLRVRASLRPRGEEDARAVAAAATLHPRPRLLLATRGEAPDLDGTDGWPAAWTPIDRLAEGRVEGEGDSEGRFRVVASPAGLHVEVDVTDDRLVSNIAPDDIRGHWRSDAVEICLDPAAGSEHTLECLKVGIFPFDSSGRVRGARDADARQGPIETTAPGLELRSERHSRGYRVRAAIPWTLVGGPPADGRIGFNILIYDGDKPEAATGENIGESRLAWAPRPGVQGRPEDWGLVVIESQ